MQHLLNTYRAAVGVMSDYLTVELLTDALAEVSEIQVVAEFGEGHHRTIKYDAWTQVWNVYDHGELTTTLTPERAVEVYNSIRRRAVPS